MTPQSSAINTAFKSARGRKNRKRAPSVRNQGVLPDAGFLREPSKIGPSAPTVYGPYADGGRWRIIAMDGEIRRALKTDTLAEAERMRDEILAEFQRHTVRTFAEALAEYEESLLARGVQSAQPNVEMLRRFLPLQESLQSISSTRAESMYLAETKRLKDNGLPVANDTHHLLLRRTKYFYGWAISKRYAKANPFTDIRAVGRTKRGKLQLRIDEARKLVTVAMEHAGTLDVGSAAAVMQIFLGLRPTEAVVRIVRDLDDEGRVLWVPFGKTQNAKRRLQVPEVLRQILMKHAAGKSPDAPLLGPPGEPMHKRFIVKYRLPRLCAEAGVPRVCAHSLRGLNATLALEAGAAPQSVAAALGHSSFAMTAKHYADANTISNLSMRKVTEVLANTGQRADLDQIAKLLREALSDGELEKLCERLTG